MTQVGRRALWVLLVLAAQGAVIAQQQTAPASPLVTVTGEVKQPGSFNWTAGLTAGQAVALAGGLTDRAMATWFVKRIEGMQGTTRTVLPDFVLRAGDTVQINRRPYVAAGPRVNVLGAVRTPGVYTLTVPRDTPALAIAAAGGFAETAGRDVQLWQWVRGREHGQIDLSVSPSDVVVQHVARRSIELNTSYVPAPYDDNSAIWVPPATTEMDSSATTVSVAGEVLRPGTLQLNAATLRRALVAAGGPTARAGSTLIVRRSACADRRRPWPGRELVSYNDIASDALDIAVCDGDTIELPPNAVGGLGYRVGPFPTGSAYAWTGETGSVRWSPGLTLDTALEQMRSRSNSPIAVLGEINVRVKRRTDDGFAFLAEPRVALQPHDEIVVSPATPAIDINGGWRVTLPDDAAASLDLRTNGSRVLATLTTHGVTQTLTGELMGRELLLLASSPGKASAFVADVTPVTLHGTIDTLFSAGDLPYVEETHWQASRHR